MRKTLANSRAPNNARYVSPVLESPEGRRRCPSLPFSDRGRSVLLSEHPARVPISAKAGPVAMNCPRLGNSWGKGCPSRTFAPSSYRLLAPTLAETNSAGLKTLLLSPGRHCATSSRQNPIPNTWPPSMVVFMLKGPYSNGRGVPLVSYTATPDPQKTTRRCPGVISGASVRREKGEGGRPSEGVLCVPA